MKNIFSPNLKNLRLLLLITPFLSLSISSFAGTAYINVHAHNPEGVEIDSIQGVDGYSVEIYDGDILILYGARDADGHSRILTMNTGNHIIKAKFNGMTLEQNITLDPGEEETIIFTFPRIEVNNDRLFTNSLTNNTSKTHQIFEVRGSFSAVSWNPLYIENRTGVKESNEATLNLNVNGQLSTSKYSFNVSGTAISSSTNADIENISLRVAAGPVNNLIEIPSNNDFNNWYVQNNSDGPTEVYSYLFQISGGVNGDLIGGWNHQTGYEVHTISAKEKWAGVMMVPPYAPPINKSIGFDLQNYVEISDSVSFSVKGENLKFSSVPYDLLGTGLKEEKQEPVAEFTYLPEKSITDKEINFDASSSNDPDGTIVKYEWNFGDETVSEGQKVTHTYSKGGEYKVTLKVTDNEGLTGSKEITIIVKPALEILDGSYFSAGKEVSNDPEKLATGGILVEGAVTDGVTRLLLRLNLNKYQLITFSLEGITNNPREDGVFRSIDGLQEGNSITVNTLEVNGEHYAFAIYQAPQDFVRDNNRQDGTMSERELSIKAQFNSDSPIEQTIKLVRPPLILVHGLWSSSEMWDNPKTTDDFKGKVEANISGIRIFTVNYKDSNASCFDENKNKLRDKIAIIKENLRSNDRIAMIQVDVLGHSMGGILSRIRTGDEMWSGAGSYFHDSNFKKGDIHKIITLDSPHLGSFLADFGMGLINTLDPFSKKLLLNKARKKGFALDNGAIEDLQTTSVAIMFLNSVPTYSPTHAMVGDYTIRKDLNLIPKIGELFEILQFYGLDLSVIMYKAQSDLVVSVESQQGGLSSSSFSTFNHYHTDAVGQQVVYKTIELLNLSTRDPSFEIGFPANKWL